MAIEQPGWYSLGNVTITGSTVTANNGGVDSCFANSGGAPDAGAAGFNQYLSNTENWEFRCQLSGRNPNGRAFIGLTLDDTLNFTQWEYCLHVSTETLTSAIPPHPANSVYIYEGSSTAKAWADGIWTNDGQVIRIQNLGGVVRYFLDCTLIYRSLISPSDNLTPIIGFGCHDMQIINPEIVTGPAVGVGSGAIAEGESFGSGCSAPWTIPTPTALPQPPTVGAPIATRFQEVVSRWDEYTAQFGDGSSASDTTRTNQIRMFEVEWDGLSATEAALLDAHYDSTSGGLSFSMIDPHTDEVITGCRYGSYTLSPHTKYWSQNRQATIVKFTA